MVFFTCNHCGESVKKPAVEKHYNTKCRGAPKSVSCMDCQKDFQDNFVKHTKCISELEKYSGKGYVPKESQNKGAKKQEGWVEVVRSVLDSAEYQLSKDTRNAFLTLQNYDNIPRKKPRFLNFVTNSVRLPRKIVEEVWNILEKEQEKMKQARQSELKSIKKSKENGGANEEVNETKIKSSASDEAVDKPAENGHADEGASKKKKKEKKKDKVTNGIDDDKEHDLADGDIEKAKKKKKNKETTMTEEVAENNTSQQNGHSERGKKEKKRNAEGGEQVESNTAADGPPSSKKQKKDKDVENQESSNLSKSKKKKHQENDYCDEEPAKKKQKTLDKTNNTTKQEEENEDAYQFNWEMELARIADKYPEGLTLEKLKKKLFKKFKVKFSESELTERHEKGFDKKLNRKLTKCTKLKLEGDLVKPRN